jgi:hypothetical protein
MTEATPLAIRTAHKLMGCNSCVGCQYMYFQDTGYSNYTVLETEVRCALDLNPNLPADKPYDWMYSKDGSKNNWPKTNESRCMSFLAGNPWDPPHFNVDDGAEEHDDFFMSEPTHLSSAAKNAIHHHVRHGS